MTAVYIPGNMPCSKNLIKILFSNSTEEKNEKINESIVALNKTINEKINDLK